MIEGAIEKAKIFYNEVEVKKQLTRLGKSSPEAGINCQKLSD